MPNVTDHDWVTLSAIARHARTAKRLRVEVAGLLGDDGLAERIERSVRAQDGVQEVRASAVTGRVLIRYSDGSALVDRVIAAKRMAVGDVPRPVPEAPTGQPPFHAMPIDRVAHALGSDLQRGLAQARAAERLAHHGRNSTDEVSAPSNLALVGRQLANVPTGLLIGSAALSLLLGDVFDATAIAVVVGVNAALGYRIERKNEELLASWRKLEAGAARLLRDGAVVELPASAVVPGDLVILRAGDVVPADARVIDAHRLRADESMLSGESEPAPKRAEPVSTDAGLTDRASMLWAGTTVVAGHGRALVVATGARTTMAEIKRLVAGTAAPRSPLERKLDALGRRASVVGVAAAGVVAVAGLARRRPAVSLLRGAVALGVAAIPEGLPLVATAALVRSMARMRRQGMVVRRVSAAETLGGVTVVCADKTGTLTQNDMRVEHLVLGARTVAAAELRANMQEPLGDEVSRCLATCVLSSDVDVQAGEDGTAITGSATERALLLAAERAGFDLTRLRELFPRRRLRERGEGVHHVTSLHDVDGATLAFLKGAPEQVLALCDRDEAGPLDEARRTLMVRRNVELAEAGFRVLALAWQRLPPGANEPDGGYELLGLVSLQDPLREGSAEAIAAARRAGIRTVILTGDQRATAQAVAKAVGIAGHARDGAEILPRLRNGYEGADDDPLWHRAAILSRVSPADKLAIVEALRARGEIVAMAGDGINDGPALKAANVGIAVGRGASDLARQTADVVLTNEDLRSILAAIGEGRIVQDNLRRSIQYLLATNLSEILLMGAGALFGVDMLEPVQLLWLNLLSDTFPALALALEPGDPKVLGRSPVSPRQSLLSGRDVRRVLRDGATMGGASFAAFAVAGRTGAVSAMTALQLGYALACRAPERRPSPRFNLMLAGTAGLQLFGMLLPPVRGRIGLARPGVLSLAGMSASFAAPWLLRRAFQSFNKGERA